MTNSGRFDDSESLTAATNIAVGNGNGGPACITYPFEFAKIGTRNACGKVGDVGWKITVDFCESGDNTQWEFKLGANWHSGAIIVDDVVINFESGLELNEFGVSRNILAARLHLNVGRHVLTVYGTETLGFEGSMHAAQDRMAFLKFRRAENGGKFSQWRPVEKAILTDFCDSSAIENFALGFETGRYSDPDIIPLVSDAASWKCIKTPDVLMPDQNGHEWDEIDYNHSAWPMAQEYVFARGGPVGIDNFLQLDKGSIMPAWIGASSSENTEMFVGCFKDIPISPSFKEGPGLLDGSEPLRYTIGTCRHACAGYKYFALQEEGLSCKCGSEYGPTQNVLYEVTDMEDCTYVYHSEFYHEGNNATELCTADTTEYCLGGRDLNAVFYTEYPRVYCIKELPIQTPRTGEELADQASALGLY